VPDTEPIGELCEICGAITGLVGISAALLTQDLRLVIVSGTVCSSCRGNFHNDAGLIAELLRRRAGTHDKEV
jgi:hypothetical protein